MSYYSREQLELLGFRSLGKNVKVSDKAVIYDHDKIEIGDHTRIDDFCVLSGKIKFERYVHVAPQCLIAGGSEGVVMQDFSGLAYQVQVFSQSDDYSGLTMTNPTVPQKYKNENKAAVNIGRHCIIGSGSVIGPGVTIGEGTSVGALALVFKSTEEWSIYAGNPARKIRERKKDLLDLEKQLWQESEAS